MEARSELPELGSSTDAPSEGGPRPSPTIQVRMSTALINYGIASLGLVLTAPVFLLLAVLIKLGSPGPTFYRRRVLGLGGCTFHAIKFRTMFVNGDEIIARHPGLESELEAKHKLRDDPRVTRVGRWLRQFSLDELPQLINVLRGEMRLVGPRMISPDELARYGERGADLLTVKPGLTGPWQVSGRSDLPDSDRVRLDLEYVDQHTLGMDLRILFIDTLPAVLRRRGAY